MTEKLNVAVAGATGAVGQAMLEILAERNFPVDRIFPLASERSAGSTVLFKNKPVMVEDLATFDFTKARIGLFSPGAAVSKIYAPRAAEAGCVVIDNTSQFRYEPEIPLVVPEVNVQAIDGYRRHGIIANPNCSTIQLVVALKPIYDEVGIERINICTYQAVSGAGKPSIEELASQTAALLSGKNSEPRVLTKQIAFNAIPHIDVFQENGYTREEMKIVWETRKILADETIRVNATAVRIPVFYGHSEAVHLETRKPISADKAREILAQAPGVQVIDERIDGGYPTAVTEAAHADGVFVGRIRQDISCDRGLNMWIVSDNVRKGAALNTVQIAEELKNSYL